MTKRKIYLLNGPAGSGKDTWAKHFTAKCPDKFHHDKFAWPFKIALKEFFNLTEEEFWMYEDDQESKNTPCERFFGKSWREVLIGFSEMFIKPFYEDKALFGKMFIQRNINSYTNAVLVSDSGFVEEAEAVVNFEDFEVTLVRIHREGCDYGASKDSRGYINLDHLGVPSFDMYNNGTVEDWIKQGNKFFNV